MTTRAARRAIEATLNADAVKVVDAEFVGYPKVLAAVQSIAEKELKQDESATSPGEYIEPTYFTKRTDNPGDVERILVAIASEIIVGFIIIINTDKNSSYVSYLAVDEKAKSLGIGKKLMLSAMNQIKLLGKRYLDLEYVKIEGYDDRNNAKAHFYNKFGEHLPMTAWSTSYTKNGLEHLFPRYELTNADLKLVEENLFKTKKLDPLRTISLPISKKK